VLAVHKKAGALHRRINMKYWKNIKKWDKALREIKE
jgi:hypothetical protein